MSTVLPSLQAAMIVIELGVPSHNPTEQTYKDIAVSVNDFHSRSLTSDPVTRLVQRTSSMTHKPVAIARRFEYDGQRSSPPPTAPLLAVLPSHNDLHFVVE